MEGLISCNVRVKLADLQARDPKDASGRITNKMAAELLNALGEIGIESESYEGRYWANVVTKQVPLDKLTGFRKLVLMLTYDSGTVTPLGEFGWKEKAKIKRVLNARPARKSQVGEMQRVTNGQELMDYINAQRGAGNV